MNTEQLECFVQVAGNLNFRRAADELHLSQPTVSKQVAALERELGGDLFVRTTRSVVLTALGESFLPDAREVLRLVYASKERALRKVQGSSLAIGYSDSNELSFLAPLLGELRRRIPEVLVRFVQGARDASIERLSREQVDAVLGFEAKSLEVGGITFRKLCDDNLVCVVRADSPLAVLDVAGGDDVAGQPQVVCLPASLRRRGYAAEGSIPDTQGGAVTYCSTTVEALCLVDAGFGYALLPSVEAVPAVGRTLVRWTGSPKAAYGVYLREGDAGETLQAFCEVAGEAYASQVLP